MPRQTFGEVLRELDGDEVVLRGQMSGEDEEVEAEHRRLYVGLERVKGTPGASIQTKAAFEE